MADLVPTVNVEWVQGDDNDMAIVVTDPTTGLPVDLTGGKVWLYAKVNGDDADADAVVRLDSDPGNGINLTVPSQGQAIARLTPPALAAVAAPRWLYYAVQARAQTEDGLKTWEVLRGTAYVSRGIVGAAS